MNNQTYKRRLADIDSVKSGGWVEHGDGTRTHVGSPFGIHAGRATSSDGRAYRKDSFRGWRRDPLQDEPHWSTAGERSTNKIYHSLRWNLPSKYRTYGGVSGPGGCGFLGSIFGALWLGLCLCSLLRSWWQQSPVSLIANGLGLGFAIVVRPFLRWVRRAIRRKPNPVKQSSVKATHTPECSEGLRSAPRVETRKPRTAAQLDVYK